MRDTFIAENLKALRAREDLSQRALGDILYISPWSVNMWEAGKNYPHILMLVSICEKFNLTLDELVLGHIKAN